MISIFCGVLGMIVVVMMARKRLAAFIAGFFVIFQLAYRLPDVVYLDIFGPIYAIELERHVGGNMAAPYFLLACLCFLAPLWFAYRPSYLARKVAAPVPDVPVYRSIRRAAFLFCVALVAIMYIDMVRVGPIPLLVGMDRLEYKLIASPLYTTMYSNGFLFTTILGMFVVLPRLQGKSYDVRFIFIFLAVLVYWALTGNRFSIFYRDISFFVIPFAAVIWMQTAGRLAPIERRDAWSALLSSRVILPIVGIVAAIAVAGLLLNSYYNVRGYADPVFQMTQRTIVQPVELYVARWAHVDFTQFGLNREALDFLVFNPIGHETNTSIQYLMFLELGYFRTAELIDVGSQYAGGYPEILLELAGGWLAVPLMLAFGAVSVFLLRLCSLALARGHLLTCLAGTYVYFGFTLLYIGGMLTFLLAFTYLLKVAFFLLTLAFEGRILAGARGAPGPASPPAGAPRRGMPRPRRA